MAVSLLLLFVLGLFLLPVVYAQRARRQWWSRLKTDGTAAMGRVVSLQTAAHPHANGWKVLEFEYTHPAHELSIKARVLVKDTVIRQHSLSAGAIIAIRYYASIPAEAAPEDIECLPFAGRHAKN
jgi:hypothetical protein